VSASRAEKRAARAKIWEDRWARNWTTIEDGRYILRSAEVVGPREITAAYVEGNRYHRQRIEFFANPNL